MQQGSTGRDYSHNKVPLPIKFLDMWLHKYDSFWKASRRIYIHIFMEKLYEPFTREDGFLVRFLILSSVTRQLV